MLVQYEKKEIKDALEAHQKATLHVDLVEENILWLEVPEHHKEIKK